MDFIGENPALFAVIAVTIFILVIYFLVSRIRRRKQEREMSSGFSYTSSIKSSSKNKGSTEKSPFKYSLSTGELLDAAESDTPPTITEAEAISKIEEQIRKTDLSESQKLKAIEEFKKHMSKPKEDQSFLNEKITYIQNSNLSESKKKVLIEKLKKLYG